MENQRTVYIQVSECIELGPAGRRMRYSAQLVTANGRVVDETGRFGTAAAAVDSAMVLTSKHGVKVKTVRVS